jgi:hypothetical protein
VRSHDSSARDPHALLVNTPGVGRDRLGSADQPDEHPVLADLTAANTSAGGVTHRGRRFDNDQYSFNRFYAEHGQATARRPRRSARSSASTTASAPAC